MLSEFERCVPNHIQCSAHHAAMVLGYIEERQRQELQAEEASLGYNTEFQEYIDEHPLVTFKQWLIGNRRS